MNAGDNNGAQDLKNTDKDDVNDLKNGDNSDYDQQLKSVDNSEGEVLLNDGKGHLQDADKNDGQDLNDGEDHLQNGDDNDGKDLQIADKNDYLQNTDNNDGKDLQSADNNDGDALLQNTDANDDNSDYSDDEDMHYNDDGYPMFEQMYRCYPVSYIDKAHLENGDKVLMPPSALQQLAYLEIDFPILFELSNPSSGKVTHCGVLEFTANEGTMFLPSWMMDVLLIKDGDSGLIKYVSLLKGTYVKLQPHTMDFLDISNPKAVLERVLRSYSCLTTGGTIVLPYNDKKYYVDIVETKPSAAVCIIETDCEVDFAAPLDYKEPENPQVDEEPEKKKVKAGPFTGPGRRLDGKPSAQEVETVSSPVMKQQKLQSGALVFGSNTKGKQISSKEKAQDSVHDEEEKKFKAFTGKKYVLKDNAS